MLLPPHFFFVFLYYTDVGSLTLVLAAYLVRRRARPALQRRLGALHASAVNSSVLHEGSPVNCLVLLKQLSRARASFTPLDALGAVPSTLSLRCMPAGQSARPAAPGGSAGGGGGGLPADQRGVGGAHPGLGRAAPHAGRGPPALGRRVCRGAAQVRAARRLAGTL